MTADQQSIDSKVIPVMREAVTMVQMILYRRLKAQLETEKDYQAEAAVLAGAVVNNLFGTLAADEAITRYGSEHRQEVEDQLRSLASRIPALLPLLTDALRMKVICDNQEGFHSIGSLLMARALGLLQEERDLPLPSTFMCAVRTLAVAEGLVEPLTPVTPPANPPA